ncbi:hypothetical protein ACFSTC_50710 [Nonomuraea ferruginea]
MAADMSQKLLRIGLSSHPFSDAHLALTSAALLKPGDVAVAISCSGETPDVLVPARTAAETGGAAGRHHQQPALLPGRARPPHPGVGGQGDRVPARRAGQPDQPAADRGLHLRGAGAADLRQGGCRHPRHPPGHRPLPSAHVTVLCSARWSARVPFSPER